MLNPNNINTLINMGPKDLTQVLDSSGYLGCKFDTAVFKGINREGQFVYRVVHADDDTEDPGVECSVFVAYDHDKGRIWADF